MAVFQLALLHVGAWSSSVMALIQAPPVAANELALDDRETMLASEVTDFDAPPERLWHFSMRGAPNYIVRSEMLAEVDPHAIDGLADVEKYSTVAHSVHRATGRVLPAG